MSYHIQFLCIYMIYELNGSSLKKNIYIYQKNILYINQIESHGVLADLIET